MAKGDPLTSHQQKIVDRYYDNLDTIALNRVQEMVSEIYLAEPGPKKDKLWRTVETHLRKVGAPTGQVERVLADQDVKQLAQLVTDMVNARPAARPASSAPAPAAPAPATPTPSASPATAPAQAPAPATSATGASPAAAFTQEDLKLAYKAFKKRLKLSRLDEESKLGRNPLTSGKGSGIVAISPPNQYPQAVWDELVKQGKLKPAGRGFYSVVGE